MKTTLLAALTALAMGFGASLSFSTLCFDFNSGECDLDLFPSEFDFLMCAASSWVQISKRGTLIKAAYRQFLRLL